MSPLEDHCLGLIQRNLMRLSADGSVEYWHHRNKRWYVKKPNHHNKSGRVKYQFHGAKYVYANRLVWMLAKKEPIPEDCFVDHIDENRRNDAVDNMQLYTKKESHRQGFNAQIDSVLERLGRWFEFVADMGREPEHLHELTYVECGF